MTRFRMMAEPCVVVYREYYGMQPGKPRGTTSPLPETIDRPQAALSMTTTLRNNRLHSGRRCWPGLRFLHAEPNDVERRQEDQRQQRRHRRPPMIAKAIGPQNTVGAIGIMPSTVETAVSRIGRKRCSRRLDHRIPRLPALRPLGLDLVDQDHRVAGDHADQREDAEDRDEAERLA